MGKSLSKITTEMNTQIERILDACPIACLVFDEHLQAIDCNAITVEISGTKTKEELITTFQDFSPTNQSDGEDSRLKIQRYLIAAWETGREQLELLSDTKVNIDGVENGQKALDRIAEHPSKYDLILMDMQMPVMDGLTATRKIRQMSIPNAKTIPIYAMTANAFKEDEEQCIAAGMNGFFSKPVDFVKLYGVLEKEFDS